MDKITRMLTLYQCLFRGDCINKSLYAMKFEIAERSFDRDIQDMRLFLSESFSCSELIYDAERGGYRLKGLVLKREIAIGECYILSKLLLDSQPLRTDDLAELLQILLSQLTPDAKERILPVLRHAPEPPIRLEKASVKLVADLLLSIEYKDRISLQFGTNYSEVLCAPYSVEFCEKRSFLVGWDIALGAPALFPLDDILSYIPAKHPYHLGHREEQALQDLILALCRNGPDACRSYIRQKESV